MAVSREVDARLNKVAGLGRAIVIDQCRVLANEFLQVRRYVVAGHFPDGTLNLQAIVAGDLEVGTYFHVKLVLEIALFGNLQTFNIEVRLIDRVERVLFRELL